MNAKRLLLIVSLLFIAACGAGSPSGPVQLPQTIEYAGKSVSDDYINVQTDSTIQFVVKNAAGEAISPETVTGTILDKDGNPVSDDSYGTLGISADGQYVEYTANPDFPDLVTTAGLTFESNVSGSENALILKGLKADTTLPSFDLGISASIDQIRNGDYAFRDFVADDTYSYSGPKLAISRMTGRVNMLMMKMDWNGSTWLPSNSLAFTSTSIEDLENGTSSTLSLAPIKTIADHSGPSSIYVTNSTLAAYDNNEMAALYALYDYQDMNDKFTDVFFTSTSDSGETWSTPLLVAKFNHTEHDFKDIYMNMKYDRNGVLHVIYYIFSVDGNIMIGNNLYYSNCSASGCATPLTINQVANTGGNPILSLPSIAIDDRDSATVKIYTSWMYYPVALTELKGTTQLSEIDYDVASGTASVAWTEPVQNYSLSECIAGIFEHVALDAQYSPIISWLEYTGNDPCGSAETTSLSVKTARYNSTSAIFDTALSVASIDPTTGYAPNMIVTNTDFSNTAHVAWLEAHQSDTSALSKTGYSAEIFDVNNELFSMIDLIDNQTAPLVRDLSANTSYLRFGGADSATDDAGRSYFVWFNKDTGKLNFTIGTIWR